MIPLYETQPDPLPPDGSLKITLNFTSPADGSPRLVDVYVPSQPPSNALPLVLAPHPITWRPDQDYHLGVDGLTRGYHRGYYGLAQRHGVIIAIPHGHHRAVDLCSLGCQAQIEDMAHLIDFLPAKGYPVDPYRVYACGLSMGGQEALLVAGRFPERIAAVCVFNPIVDLAAWQIDLARTEIEKFREIDLGGMIAAEVGGLPSELPGEYALRSATSYIDGLAQVPSMIFWSEHDLIVPRQATHHSWLLYQMLKTRGPATPVGEYNHTRSHAAKQFDQLTRWQIHEWCDYDLALHWLAWHVK
jgi:hypothetical protein